MIGTALCEGSCPTAKDTSSLGCTSGSKPKLCKAIRHTLPLHDFRGRKELLTVAHEAAKSATIMLREHGGNARKHDWVDALNFWLEGKPTGAIVAMEAIFRDRTRRAQINATGLG